MARGFESKDVEFQQAEAEQARTPGRALTSTERDVEHRRQTLNLSLVRMRADLTSAHAPAHRRMIEQAIAALEADVRSLSRP